MGRIPSRPSVIIIAHRGASRQAPESTAAAIRLALAARVDMIELDVQMTQDRRLVIFHDDRLSRTTNGRGRLTHRRYRDLAGLDAGSWFAPRFAGERLLLVSQALRLIPMPCRINLELKRTRRPAALIRGLVRVLHWTRTTPRALVSSFDPSLMARLRARAPRVPTALLCRRHPQTALRQASRLGCVALHPHHSLVTPTLIGRAHAAGLRVHAWVVDRPARARRLIRMGVDGLFTNAPAVIRAGARP